MNHLQEAGQLKRLNVTVAKLCDSNKPKAFIQWVSDHASATVRHYERLWVHYLDGQQISLNFKLFNKFVESWMLIY